MGQSFLLGLLDHQVVSGLAEDQPLLLMACGQTQNIFKEMRLALGTVATVHPVTLILTCTHPLLSLVTRPLLSLVTFPATTDQRGRIMEPAGLNRTVISTPRHRPGQAGHSWIHGTFSTMTSGLKSTRIKARNSRLSDQVFKCQIMCIFAMSPGVGRVN